MTRIGTEPRIVIREPSWGAATYHRDLRDLITIYVPADHRYLLAEQPDPEIFLRVLEEGNEFITENSAGSVGYRVLRGSSGDGVDEEFDQGTDRTDESHDDHPHGLLADLTRSFRGPHRDDPSVHRLESTLMGDRPLLEEGRPFQQSRTVTAASHRLLQFADIIREIDESFLDPDDGDQQVSVRVDPL